MKKVLFLLPFIFILLNCEFSDPPLTYEVKYSVYNYQSGNYIIEYLNENEEGQHIITSTNFYYSFNINGNLPDLIFFIDNTSDTLLIFQVYIKSSHMVDPIIFEKVVEPEKSFLYERFN